MSRSKKLAPIHPGEILLEEFLKPFGMSMNKLAEELHVPSNRITQIVEGRRSITGQTALSPTVADNLSGPGAPLIVPALRCGLMSASPLGPAEQCGLRDLPPPHQSPQQTPHLGHGQLYAYRLLAFLHKAGLIDNQHGLLIAQMLDHICT